MDVPQPDASRPDSSRPFTAAEADAVLSGQAAPNGSRADVSPVLDVLRAAAHVSPDSTRVQAMASRLASVAAAAATDSAATHELAPATPKRAAKARTRIASVAAAVFALALGTAGVAAASEGALPGDPLYTVKRTLEDIGIYEGGLQVRLDETVELAERGDQDAALEHLADSLEEEGDDESAESLRNAAEAVLSGGSDQSLATRTAVSEMLQWMADTELTGREFGQGVAERARAINHPVADDPVEGEPVDGDNGLEPEGPVKPEGPGKPEDTGKPGDTGKPEDTGTPDDTGKPDAPGKPEKPVAPGKPGKADSKSKN